MPSFFVKSLLRIALLQGRGVLLAIITGQFTIIAQDGGKQLTGSSGGGKSFQFQVPSKLTTDELMASAEEALEYFDGNTTAAIETMLSTAPQTRAVATFA